MYPSCSIHTFIVAVVVVVVVVVLVFLFVVTVVCDGVRVVIILVAGGIWCSCLLL
jgi:hypothetical protein